jgi:hypothetical protein
VDVDLGTLGDALDFIVRSADTDPKFVSGDFTRMTPLAMAGIQIYIGQHFCDFDIEDVGRFGVSICHDIWVPETTRTMVAMGAEVILHPVNTTFLDRDIDILMARAAAAANQCYVFDINGLSAGGVGRSCGFDRSARVIHQAGTHQEIIPIEIDLDQVRRQRLRGIRILGQPLKSFRDCTVDFTV